ncbi:MAG: hypothetical protein GY696_21605 [Gammaproteobacteria bacterium]|nr:hypothetical protein [Gammaproteobacteria bacterium]
MPRQRAAPRSVRIAGYANSHVDGSAPFCSGGCYNGSGDSQVEPYWANGTGYIDCAGSSSDGSSCWSGSKQCSCWNQINCSNQCLGGSLAEWGDYEATDSFCAERSDVSDLVSSGNKVRIIGACSWSDTMRPSSSATASTHPRSCRRSQE